jgi:hypothetical protein
MRLRARRRRQEDPNHTAHHYDLYRTIILTNLQPIRRDHSLSHLHHHPVQAPPIEHPW